MSTFGEVLSNTPLTRQLIVALAELGMGPTAPTEVDVGTTPQVEGLLFNAVGETVSMFVQMPTNWDRTVDVELVLAIELADAEVNGDVLDLVIDYVVPIRNSSGNGIAKTSTQITPTLTVTTANGLVAGDAYEVRATFASGDATNPFTDANAVGFGIDPHLGNLIGVGAFHLFSACIVYEALR